MRFNVGIEGKRHCFVDVDITLEEYRVNTDKVVEAIKEKYGFVGIIGYCPAEEQSL
jgi:hypothetical protein